MRALITIYQHNGVVDMDSMIAQEAYDLQDAAATGDEIVNDERTRARREAAFDATWTGAFRLHTWIDEGRGGFEREGGREQQSTNRHPRDHIVRLHLGAPQRLGERHFLAHQLGGDTERGGIADEQLGVDEDGGVYGAATEGEIAKADGSQLIHRTSEP